MSKRAARVFKACDRVAELFYEGEKAIREGSTDVIDTDKRDKEIEKLIDLIHEEHDVLSAEIENLADEDKKTLSDIEFVAPSDDEEESDYEPSDEELSQTISDDDQEEDSLEEEALE